MKALQCLTGLTATLALLRTYLQLTFRLMMLYRLSQASNREVVMGATKYASDASIHILYICTVHVFVHTVLTCPQTSYVLYCVLRPRSSCENAQSTGGRPLTCDALSTAHLNCTLVFAQPLQGRAMASSYGTQNQLCIYTCAYDIHTG